MMKSGKGISNIGSVKVLMCQMEVVQGRPALNTAAMLEAISSGKEAGAELILFPELAVSGSALGRLWHSDAFLRECERCGAELRAASRGTVVMFGNVAVDWARRNNDGSARKYNALFVAEDGRFVAPVNGPYSFVIKSCLPGEGSNADAGIFFDITSLALELGRTLEQLTSPVIAGGLSVGCLLCGESVEGASAAASALCRHPVNLFVAASASPFLLGSRRRGERLALSSAGSASKPLIFINGCGVVDTGKAVLVLEGGSGAYNSAARPVASLALFNKETALIEVPLSGKAGKASFEEEPGRPELTCRALLAGLPAFAGKLGVEKAVIGASGGIDSAVVAALHSVAFGPENVLLVNMPGEFVSPGGVELARKLAANLGCFYSELPIDPSVELTLSQINRLQVSSSGGLTQELKLTEAMLENVQARDRSSRVLSALASAFGGVPTCNSNKAEMTVGYSTLYGDLAGYLAPIADLWKWEVYELGRHLNEAVFGRDAIPNGSFERVPSAELNPRQNADAGGGDPFIYPYHDRLFASWVEWACPASPEDILLWHQAGALEEKIGYGGSIEKIFPEVGLFVADLERWWTRFQSIAAAKLVQAPPIIVLKERPLIEARSCPQLGAWFSSAYLELKKKLLNDKGTV